MSEESTQKFYLKVSKVFDGDESLEHEKIVALLRVALEKGAKGKMGVFTVCDMLAVVRNTTLKMVEGKDASFETILEDFSPEKRNKTLH